MNNDTSLNFLFTVCMWRKSNSLSTEQDAFIGWSTSLRSTNVSLSAQANRKSSEHLSVISSLFIMWTGSQIDWKFGNVVMYAHMLHGVA